MPDARRLEAAVDHHQYPFDHRVVYVNNVDDPVDAMRRAERMMSRGLIDEAVLVKDHAQAALAFFELTENELGSGYPYSISEIVGLYLLRSELLVHLAGDTILAGPTDWIPLAVDLMAERNDVAVVNLAWTDDVGSVLQHPHSPKGPSNSGSDFLTRCTLCAEPIFGHLFCANEIVLRNGTPAMGVNCSRSESMLGCETMVAYERH